MYFPKNFDDFAEQVKSKNVQVWVTLVISDKGCGEIAYRAQIKDKLVQYNQESSRNDCEGKNPDEMYEALREEAKENLECLEIICGVDYNVSTFGGDMRDYDELDTLTKYLLEMPEK